ncbi:Lcl C-terminal domain-containing protein [Kaarinaea lacus]
MVTPRTLIFISLCLCLFSSQATHQFDDPSDRFIKLGGDGVPLDSANTSWDCVLDRKTALIWEIKTTHGLRHRNNTYTWYVSQSKLNGGAEGVRDGGHCTNSQCDTQSYIDAVNRSGLCSFHDWRLPSREELRSLVDYQLRPPRPIINTDYFPNTLPQFYWSSTLDANDPDSAWGIGFTFGYDYSYFKSDLGYVRLVTNGGKSDKTSD